jgi:hypothetical protein
MQSREVIVVEAGKNKDHVAFARPGAARSAPETALDDLTHACWRKSSWSSYNGNCVEVAELTGQLIGVRDTKDAGVGPVLVFGHAAWRSFLHGVKNGG